MSDMARLFYHARKFGDVNIFTTSDGYSCTMYVLNFTIHSGFGHSTVEEAIEAAISIAHKKVEELGFEIDELRKLVVRP